MVMHAETEFVSARVVMGAVVLHVVQAEHVTMFARISQPLLVIVLSG